MMLSSVQDYGYEREDKYNEWSYSDEYGKMAVAYYIAELKKEELKKVV
jgi:hypothetical protein